MSKRRSIFLFTYNERTTMTHIFEIRPTSHSKKTVFGTAVNLLQMVMYEPNHAAIFLLKTLNDARKFIGGRLFPSSP